ELPYAGGGFPPPVRRSAPKGIWTVQLSTTSAATIDFDAWIERDDFGRLQQSTFIAADRDASCTLGTLSCGAATIIVGAHDPDDPAATDSAVLVPRAN